MSFEVNRSNPKEADALLSRWIQMDTFERRERGTTMECRPCEMPGDPGHTLIRTQRPGLFRGADISCPRCGLRGWDLPEHPWLDVIPLPMALLQRVPILGRYYWKYGRPA